MKIPDVLPLFPLPDHVLLPGYPAPYRVFEPRYRALVRDLRELPEEKRWLAIPRLAPGWEGDYEGRPPVHRVAVAARLMRSTLLAEGEFHVVVEGEVRCRLSERPSPLLYRLADAEPWPDEPPASPRETVPAIQALAQLLIELGQATGADVKNLLRILHAPETAELRVWRLASVLLRDPDSRQRLLEDRSLVQRADRLVEALATAVAHGGRTGGAA